MSRYDRYDARGPRGAARPAARHSLLGFWVPVAMTTAIAAGGLAAWVIGSRTQHHPSSASASDDDDLSYGEGGTDHGAGPSGRRPAGPPGAEGARASGADVGPEDAGILGRVAGAIRRSPSPQQMLDGAGKRVAAGVAAAGAAAGAALSAIREDHGEDDDFADHERWRREELAAGARGGGSAREAPARARGARTVAIVVSAAEGRVEEEKGWKSEQAVSGSVSFEGVVANVWKSLLSHIPPVDPSKVNLLVLIYAPRLQEATAAGSGKLPSSLASSYSNINAPSEDMATVDPQPLSNRSSGASYYDLVHRQAVRLVRDPVAIMPFTSPTGYMHMLKHIEAETVYVVDSLAGRGGENVVALQDWARKIVVVVGGDAAGLVDDTEEEGHAETRRRPWWEGSSMIGLGKRVEVVEAVRVGDDFARRVGGKE